MLWSLKTTHGMGEAKGRYIRYQARAGEEFVGWVFTDEIIVE